MSKLTVLFELLRQDMVRFKREFWSKLLDTSFLLFTNLVVFGYFMPQLGVSNNYGPLMLVAGISAFGFFDIVGKVSSLISDIDGERTISYTLTLPLPSWLVFARIGINWTVNSILISFFLFPIGKLILYNQFDLSKIAYFRLLVMYLSMNLFYGFFGLWLVSVLKNLQSIGHLWVRVINPLLMFGAYFYTWHAAYLFSPGIALATLINPLVYVMEGMRSATLGHEGFLPFWICLPALWVFIGLFSWQAIQRLQKRLDCV